MQTHETLTSMEPEQPQFFELARQQRAHRRFRDDEVSEQLIEQLLDAAVRAPSAENRQPWEFIVVRSPERRAAIGTLMRRAWDGGAQQWSATRLSPALLADVESGIRGGIAEAPVLIVVAVDLQRGMEATLGSSIYPAIQNLLLAATAMGLGSALTTIATSFHAELAELLATPPHLRLVAVIPIGWPGVALGPSRREPVASRMHHETYGNHWSIGGQ